MWAPILHDESPDHSYIWRLEDQIVSSADAHLLLNAFILVVVRLVLGIGESVAYPSYSKISAKYFPEPQRGFANSLIASGLASGPAFGMLLGGMLWPGLAGVRSSWASALLAFFGSSPGSDGCRADRGSSRRCRGGQP